MVNIIIGLFIFVIGTCFASFFGVVISRVPNKMSIVKPDSHCFNCDHELKWYENIPLISYIVLKGKCSNCNTKIGIFSFIYELVGGLVPLFIFIKFGINVESILIMVISLILLLMAGYDYKTNTILDIMWMVFGILVLMLFMYRSIFLFIPFKNYLISFAIGSIIFIFIKLFGLFILKMDILGTGDVIVFGLSCLLFNPLGILISLIISCVPGSIIELIKLSKSKEEKEIAFLPYLAFGIYIAILFTPFITNLLFEVI